MEWARTLQLSKSHEVLQSTAANFRVCKGLFNTPAEGHGCANNRQSCHDYNNVWQIFSRTAKNTTMRLPLQLDNGLQLPALCLAAATVQSQSSLVFAFTIITQNAYSYSYAFTRIRPTAHWTLVQAYCIYRQRRAYEVCEGGEDNLPAGRENFKEAGFGEVLLSTGNTNDMQIFCKSTKPSAYHERNSQVLSTNKGRHFLSWLYLSCWQSNTRILITLTSKIATAQLPHLHFL